MANTHKLDLEYALWCSGFKRSLSMYEKMCWWHDKAVQLAEACEAFLDYRQEMIDAGGINGPLPEDLILRFAHIQGMVVDRMEVALAASGTEGSHSLRSKDVG